MTHRAFSASEVERQLRRAASQSPLVEPDVRISRIRLSERGQRRHTQGNSGGSESEPEQTQLPQLPLLTDAFRRTAAPLTASEQMLPQTMPEVTIELVEGSAWKAEAEVVRPASAVPVEFRNQPRQRLKQCRRSVISCKTARSRCWAFFEGNTFQYH